MKSRGIDISNGNIRKLLIQYMLPSVAGTIGYAGLIFLDTMFIGQAIGPVGLAAISIAIPMYSVFNGISLLIGVGAATILSISQGEGKEDRVNKIFSHAIILNIIVSILFVICSFLFLDKIVYFMGANPENAESVKEYLQIVMPCGVFFMSANVLNILSKNDKAPRAAMWGMIVCSTVNIVLDYVFMFPLQMGMKGAAIATVIAALLGCIPSFYHFLRKSQIKFKFIKLEWNIVKRIVETGGANFITEICLAIVILTFNVVLNTLAGSIGVSAYSIIMNVSLVFISIFNGIAQGMQPLLSVNYGAGNIDRVNKIYKISRNIAFLCGCLFFLTGVLFPEGLVMIFNGDSIELVEMTARGIEIYFIAFIVLGVNIINVYYYQSIEKPNSSNFLSALRGIVLVIIGLLTLPRVFGINGVWMVAPIAEILTFIIGTLMIRKTIKRIEIEK